MGPDRTETNFCKGRMVVLSVGTSGMVCDSGIGCTTAEGLDGRRADSSPGVFDKLWDSDSICAVVWLCVSFSSLQEVLYKAEIFTPFMTVAILETVQSISSRNFESLVNY